MIGTLVHQVALLALALPPCPTWGANASAQPGSARHAAAAEDKGPAVGSIAPEPGLRGWLQRQEDSRVTLEALRGRVVLLHTFAWNCSSCLKVGLPLVVDLLEANEERGLSVLSITTPAYADETREVLQRFGVRHPVASEAPFGSANPYVDASVNPITYVFVIGRNGDVVWRGDPSTKLEECLDAIASALEQPTGRGLERALHAELDEAVQLYFAGEWSKARKTAEKIGKKHGRKSKGDSPAIASDASHLVAHIDRLGDALVSEIEQGLDAGDGDQIARAHHDLARLLPKSAATARADELLERLDDDPSLAQRVESAERWHQLAITRPALFPVRDDRTVKKYLNELRRFAAKAADETYRARAEAWLASWSQLHEER